MPIDEQSPNAGPCHPEPREGRPEGGRSHKVHLRSAGNLPEVLRFAQDNTLLVLLSQRHSFNKGRPDFRSRVDLRGTMA